MESRQQTQIVSRRAGLWKVVKTLFMPAQTIAKLMVGCGRKRGKGQRKLTLKSMQQAKDAFIRASLHGAVSRSNSRRNHSVLVTENGGESSYLRSTIQVPFDAPVPVGDGPPEYDASTPAADDVVNSIPAPLNIAEAELLLESLAINESNLPTDPTASASSQSSDPNDEVNVSTDDSNNVSLLEESVFIPVSESGESQDANNNFSETSRVRNRSISFSQPTSSNNFSSSSNDNSSETSGSLKRSKTSASFSSAVSDSFHGWKQSSIEISPSPPVTLTYITSGLTIGDRIVWMKDDYPEAGTVRWIGKIRDQYYAGIQFDKPVGNSSGLYAYGAGMHMYKRLFTCQLPYGRFVSVNELILYKDYFDPKSKSGIVCIICRDDFLDESDAKEVDNSFESMNMVSTKCGHLYHSGCLTQWFNTKKRKEFHCPCCSRRIELNEVIRIFPSQV